MEKLGKELEAARSVEAKLGEAFQKRDERENEMEGKHRQAIADMDKLVGEPPQPIRH